MKYLILVLSVLFLVVVIVDMTSWILLASKAGSFEEAKSLYLSNHPDFMRNATKITVLNIVLGSLAGIGFLTTRNKINKVATNTMQILACLSFFLVSWQLFSLL
jgi:hypothetical protein